MGARCGHQPGFGESFIKLSNLGQDGSRAPAAALVVSLTQHIGGVDLQDQPAVAVLFVGAEDGEDGALLPGLRQQPVHKHWLLREGERLPGFPFVGAVPAEKKEQDVRSGQVFPCPRATSSPSPRPASTVPPLLELVGLRALRDGHENAPVVAPGVIMGPRQCLEEKRG